jgi:hypothetical protein
VRGRPASLCSSAFLRDTQQVLGVTFNEADKPFEPAFTDDYRRRDNEQLTDQAFDVLAVGRACGHSHGSRDAFSSQIEDGGGVETGRREISQGRSAKARRLYVCFYRRQCRGCKLHIAFRPSLLLSHS